MPSSSEHVVLSMWWAAIAIANAINLPTTATPLVHPPARTLMCSCPQMAGTAFANGLLPFTAVLVLCEARPSTASSFTAIVLFTDYGRVHTARRLMD